MSEITNLNVKLKDNYYGDILISFITSLTDVNSRTARNPWEALAGAVILANRMRNWNTGATQASRGNYDICCCPPNTYPPDVQQCAWKELTAYGCPTCGATQAVATVVGATPPGGVLDKDLIRRGAATARMGDPYTPAVLKFETELNGINTSIQNGWTFLNQLVDEYYANVNFMDYFTTEFYGGTVHKLYLSMLGGTYQEGYQPTGLAVSTIADGEPAVPGTRGDTIIQVISTDASIDTKYWIMYTSATTADCAWIDTGVGSGAPTVSIPGVTITYRQVVINPLGTPDAVIGEIITAFGGIPGYASILQGPSDTVTFKVATGGLLPASDFTGLTGGTFNWIGSHVPGTDPVPGINEVTQIHYRRAIATELDGRWFRLFNETKTHLFYYQVTEYGVYDPASFGVAYDFAHVIELTNAPCPPPQLDGPPCIEDTRSYVQELTTATIVGTGLWTQSYKDGYYSRYNTVAEDNDTNADGGTANFGGDYQVTALVAPNGQNFGGDYKFDDDFAAAWNRIVVPYMADKGGTYYLKAVKLGPPRCCPCPCGPPEDCYGETSEDCGLQGSAMLRTTHLSVTEDLPFNVPGSSFVIRQDDRCRECLI